MQSGWRAKTWRASVRVRVTCPNPWLSCAYNSSVRFRTGRAAVMSRLSGDGRRRIEGHTQELREETGDPGEPAHVDSTAAGRWWAEIAGQPHSQRVRAQVVGMQHIDQPQILQALRANPLLGLGVHARHTEGVPLEREHFADGVVAAHGDDPVGSINERYQIGDEFEHITARVPLGALEQALALLRRHVWPGHDQAR